MAWRRRILGPFVRVADLPNRRALYGQQAPVAWWSNNKNVYALEPDRLFIYIGTLYTRYNELYCFIHGKLNNVSLQYAFVVLDDWLRSKIY